MKLETSSNGRKPKRTTWKVLKRIAEKKDLVSNIQKQTKKKKRQIIWDRPVKNNFLLRVGTELFHKFKRSEISFSISAFSFSNSASFVTNDRAQSN